MNYIQYDHGDKQVFSIDMREETTKPRSELVRKGVGKFLRDWKKVAFLVNKKWYATWTVCNECGFIPRCKNCDVAVAVHKNDAWSMIGLCHICRQEYEISPVCTNCQWVDTKTYGLWTQQVAQRVKKEYGCPSEILQNALANSKNKIQKLRDRLSSAQVVIWTSLLTAPIADRSPDLFVVVNADIWLNVPDFQANWNNFALLYDTINNHASEVFLLQSYNPESESIRYAAALDIKSMQAFEQDYRKSYKYPPYTPMCVLLYKHEIEERLLSATNKLFQELLYLKRKYEMDWLEIYTTPPMIYKIYGKYRFSIILKWNNLRTFMDIVYAKLSLHTRWFKIDREPQQLL